MGPKGIVDSDEYSPDDKLVHVATTKNKKSKNSTLLFPFSARHVPSEPGWFGVGLTCSESRMRFRLCLLLLEAVIQYGEAVFHLDVGQQRSPPSKLNKGSMK